jgi:tetratricopeptide (TPR) repeat protein
VPELPPGYRPVSEDDRKKAQRFFSHARSLAAAGNFDYAIDMFLTGLGHDPDDVVVHKELREISLKRKASGGKGLKMWDAMALKKRSKDEKVNMLNAEKLLVFDPGNSDLMLAIAQAAVKIGYYDTAMWAGPLAAQAEADGGKPDVKKFLALRDVFNQMQQWAMALQMVNIASRLKPGDMDLSVEARNLAAQQTMKGAGYDKQGSFRDQVKDMDSQLRLLDADKEVADQDGQTRRIAQAEKEYAAEPNEPGKARKLADALAATEKPEFEERAVKLLQEWFDKTKLFTFRKAIGEIRMKQMQRQERDMRLKLTDEPEAREKYAEFRRKMWEFELSEFALFFQAYPNDLTHRFEMGKRQMLLQKYDDAIASFQVARNEPRNRTDAQILLGRAFYEAKFFDEADETFGVLIRDFPNKEGQKFMEMTYWRGRTLEEKGQFDEARRLYSNIFQNQSSYRDVAARIKRLKDQAAGGPAAAPPGQ